MQPATMLIDHGHFQYNTVMLGLTASSIASLLGGKLLWASLFFVAALGFKQMALFYAPAMFAYLLGMSLIPRVRIPRLLSIGLMTIIAFALLFAPLLIGAAYDAHRGTKLAEYTEPPLLSLLPFTVDPTNPVHAPIIQLAQSIHRIFPFARGLFEDKVANAWCAIHTFHKLHQYPQALVQRAALLATLASIAPPCLILFLKPKKEHLLLSFTAVSLGFFLFSYQVHEKNILLPLLPLTMLLAGRDGLLPYIRAWVGFANTLGVWTIFPLLKRDGLVLPYFVISLLWTYTLGLPPVSISAYRYSTLHDDVGILTKLIHFPIYLAMIAWHVAEAFVPPPEDKPDLWVVANVLIGAGGFGICYLWSLYSLASKAGIFSTAKKQKTL
jgi:alpha-1,3-glucosyltransferase